MITDWSTYQIPYNGVTYQMHYRDAVNLVACDDYVPNSPSPEYPSPIISPGEVSGIDLTVTGNAGQSYQVHRDMVLRSLPDGTHDTWDVLTGTVTRRVGIYVYTGNENVTIRADISLTGNGYTCFQMPILTMLSNSAILCSHFTATSPPNKEYVWSNHVRTGDKNPQFITSMQSDISSFKSWLAAQYAAGTPVTILYKLAAPTTEQIDPEVLPTYPRYTMLNCNAEVTARVRVIEHGL